MEESRKIIQKMKLPPPFSSQRPHFHFGGLYPEEMVEREVKEKIVQLTGVLPEKIPHLSLPPQEILADFALPVFFLTKRKKKNASSIAKSLAEKLVFSPESLLEKVEAVGPYLNFSLKKNFYAQEVLSQVLVRKESYGGQNLGQGKVVVIDMSSPNIAKPMTIGHLRSTVIGHSLAKILEFLGFTVIRDNHLGDWGVQFGLLLKAWELWGKDIPELTIPGKEVEGLFQLYVRINQEIEKTKSQEKEKLKKIFAERGFAAIEGLKEAYQKAFADTGSSQAALEEAFSALTSESPLEKAAKDWFRRLERGDKEAQKKWQAVVGLSLKEFQAVYRLLGVNFDYFLGESYYNPLLPAVVRQVEKHPLAKREGGALIFSLEEEKLGEMVIETKDGRSLYSTRDLATAIFRQEKFRATEILYVVGSEQKFYFRQLFAVLKKLGYQIACQHLDFGLMRLPTGKISTREGRVVFLKKVIEEGIRRAEEIIKKKNPRLFSQEKKRREVARQVAVGAIIWGDLGQERSREILFDWEKFLSFEGYSAPYVQYAYARASSILAKEEKKKERGKEGVEISHPLEWSLVKKLANFPQVVEIAGQRKEPAVVAEYVYKLAQTFNQFYRDCPVLTEKKEKRKKTRKLLVEAVRQVMINSLYLLGIEAPEKM